MWCDTDTVSLWGALLQHIYVLNIYFKAVLTHVHQESFLQYMNHAMKCADNEDNSRKLLKSRLCMQYTSQHL